MINSFSNLYKEDNNNYFPIVLLILASFVSVLLQGFEYASGNNLFQVPIALDYLNSAEGPSDAFHQSLERYISGFWVAVSFIATEQNAPLLFLFLHITFRFLIVYMIWKITRLVTGNGILSALFVCLVLFFPALTDGNSPVGDNSLFNSTLNHSECVSAFVLWSFYLVLKRRFNWAAAMIAIVFMVNAFVGVWSGLSAGLAMLYYTRQDDIKLMALNALKMIIIFVVVALPVLIWLFNSLPSAESYASFSFTGYLRDSYPHHHFIDTHINVTIAMAILVITSLIHFDVFCKNIKQEYKELLLPLFLVLIGVLVFGAILPYVFDNRLLLSLYPLRMDTYVIFLVFIFALNWCVHSYKTDDHDQKLYSLLALSSLLNVNVLLLLASVVFGRTQKIPSRTKNYFSLALVVIAGISHSYFGEPLAFTKMYGISGVAVLLIQCGIISVFLAKKTDYMKHAYLIIAAAIVAMLPDVGSSGAEGNLIKIAIFAFYLMFGLTIYFKENNRVYNIFSSLLLALLVSLIYIKVSSTIIWTAVLLLVLSLPMINKYVLARISIFKALFETPDYKILHLFLASALILGVADFGKRGSINIDPEFVQSSRDAQKWARENTPPHTVFLTIGFSNFSILSRRPVWMDEKQHSMVIWSPETYSLWKTRWDLMKDISSIEEAHNLAIAENIKFVVFLKEFIPPDSIAKKCISYENDNYWIMNGCDL